MFTRILGITAAAALLGACWTRGQMKSVAAGDIVTNATTVDAQTGGVLPARTDVAVRLDEDLNSDRIKVDDRVTATVTTALQARNGDLVVPVGARLFGKVTALGPGGAAQPTLVQLDFNALEFQGKRYPVRAAVIDISDAVSVDAATRQFRAEATGRVVSGAELDALVSRGDLVTSTGTVIALSPAASGTAVVIPARTQMLVRTAETISLR